MKTPSLILVILLLFACKVGDSLENGTPIIEANAVIYNNNLPVDGCAEHISLVNEKGEFLKNYLPTEATRQIFSKLLDAEAAKLPNGQYSGNLQIPVVLKYRESQQKAELVCGWNKKSTVEQIEIVSITKK